MYNLYNNSIEWIIIEISPSLEFLFLCFPNNFRHKFLRSLFSFIVVDMISYDWNNLASNSCENLFSLLDSILWRRKTCPNNYEPSLHNINSSPSDKATWGWFVIVKRDSRHEELWDDYRVNEVSLRFRKWIAVFFWVHGHSQGTSQG